MNSGSSNQLQQCFLNVNWSGSTGHRGQFGPALSSLMPAQSASSAAPVFGASGNSSPKIGFSKLGHLQQLQPQTAGGTNAAASLSAMAHLDQFLADPGFAERAARFSSIDDQNYGLLSSNLGHLESNRQVPASNGVQFEVNNAALGIAKEETSASHPRSVSREGSFGCLRGSSAKKRKAPVKSKDKDVASSKVSDQEVSDTKRHRAVESNNEIDDESVMPKIDDGKVNGKDDEQKQGKEGNAKPSEPSKDYIHVRARRGQATDSHSLAERVRREKISQRMKLLQELVPGCSKVTGKAVMLDEIINYVQSLQRQVEFLSMKLATVNPHLDFDNLMSLGAKDMIQICGPLPSSVYPFEMSVESSYSNQPQERNTLLHCAVTNGMSFHSSMNMVDPTCHPNFNALKACLNGFGDDPSQLEALWGDDLQSVVHMGIGQNLENIGTFPAAQMKTEL